MKLTEKYRPKTLSEVIGQPHIIQMSRLARSPEAGCILLKGPPGVGKTAAAYAFARDLGCDPDADAFGGVFTKIGNQLKLEACEELFDRTLRFRYGTPWTVLVIEELEWLHRQCQVFLKTSLETQLPKHVIVVATSNDTSGLDKALRQRFRTYNLSGGEDFHQAAQPRLREIWKTEAAGLPEPPELIKWGMDEDGEFSMRVALDQLQDECSFLKDLGRL